MRCVIVQVPAKRYEHSYVLDGLPVPVAGHDRQS